MKKTDLGILLGAGYSDGEDDYVLEWDAKNERHYWRKVDESDTDESAVKASHVTNNE